MAPARNNTPGVHRLDTYSPPTVSLRTGVPAFLGVAVRRNAMGGPDRLASPLTRWEQFVAQFVVPEEGGFLAPAIRGFFRNGGGLCYVVPVQEGLWSDEVAFGAWLEQRLAALEPCDLICAPDVMRFETLVHQSFASVWQALEAAAAQGDGPRAIVDIAARVGSRLRRHGAIAAEREVEELAGLLVERTSGHSDAALGRAARRLAKAAADLPQAVQRALGLQAALIRHCDRAGGCFAILDALPGGGTGQLSRQMAALSGTNAALYYPWIRVPPATEHPGPGFVPPCGHVAGIYAQGDEEIGVHKAPANAVLEGVLELQDQELTDIRQAEIAAQGVNCLRSFPGRGIRVWGARTLSRDATWSYVSVRRLVLTVGRWVERNLASVAFEPHSPRLWARVERELSIYLEGLRQQGALRGASPQEAFSITCDAATNPPDRRDQGEVVAEIELAPAIPGEYIAVRVIHRVGGVSLASLSTPY